MISVLHLSESTKSAPAALVLPGAGYTAQAPMLYWTTRALIADGWRVSAVSWSTPKGREEAQGFVETAARKAIEELERVPQLIVAKSLGSFALPLSISEGIPGIWLTPLLTERVVSNALRSASDRHLAIGGTADPSWDTAAVAGTRAHLHSVAGLDHSLEFAPGQWKASIMAQHGLILRISEHANRLRE